MKSKKVITLSLVVPVALFALLLSTPYSSGYGKVVDDGIVFERTSLLMHLIRDYGRDGGEWSFGYFVPLTVVALIWFRRKDIMDTAVNPSLIVGGGILLLSLLAYFAGFRGEQKYFGYAALQVFVLGTVLWFLGWSWLKKTFWLWLLLGMMWPWRFLIGRISSPLQVIMVKCTSSFMELVGIDSHAHGSEIRTTTKDPITNLPINLDVDVECSGMRSLFALMMIGLIFAFLRVKDEWKRWFVMACVPGVAIMGNFVRMMMLYYGSAFFGTEFAIGADHANASSFHIGAGLMVFIVALLSLSGLVYVLDNGLRVFKRRKSITRAVRLDA